jgi:hypothetical protein
VRELGYVEGLNVSAREAAARTIGLRRVADEGCQIFDRAAMSSIMRRRNGLMACSVMEVLLS